VSIQASSALQNGVADRREVAPSRAAFALPSAALHEFYAASDADAPAQASLALILAGTGEKPSALWIRQKMLDAEFGAPNPIGIAELGLDPGGITLVRVADMVSALQAALEGARSPVLGSAVVEIWGEHSSLDLTASRRLALAAKASGVRLLMLRVAARPRPSAAETRWQVRSAPSTALPANAPGYPAFEVTLLRSRTGREGQHFCLEWNRETRTLALADARGNSGIAHPTRKVGGAPLPGAVVPLPADRAGDPWTEERRRSA
jgi:protein ImuA